MATQVQLRAPNIAMIAAACGFDAVHIKLAQDPRDTAGILGAR